LASVTADDLDSRLHLEGEVDDEDLENLIDGAVDLLNVYLRHYGLEIANMTGTAGTKTLTVTSAERGAVLMVACALYSRDYKAAGSQSESVSLGPASSSSSFSTAQASTEILAKELADQLAQEEVEVDIG
jgi:hypothetical protein